MKYRRNLNWLAVGGILLIVMITVILTWINFRFNSLNPGGYQFLTNWKGTQLLIKEGLNPYSDQTATLIQEAAYGHAATENEIPLRMVAPLYSIVIFLPFALIPNFPLAHAIWMTILEIAIILLAFFSVRLAGWKPGLISIVIFVIFSIFWNHSFVPLLNGDTAILVALFISGALLALNAKADELAGVLLAFATIKLQLAGLVILFILYWGARNHRWKIIGWFFATFGLLSVSAFLIKPDWILQNVRSVMSLIKTSQPDTFREAISYYLPGIGTRTGIAISYLLALLLLVEWSFGVRSQSRSFLWAVYLTFSISQWIGIPTSSGNYIFFLPALALVFALWQERWNNLGKIVSLGTMIVIFLSLWALSFNTSTPEFSLTPGPIMLLPMPAFIFIVLYWIRWWIFQPPKVWFDDITFLENTRRK